MRRPRCLLVCLLLLGPALSFADCTIIPSFSSLPVGKTGQMSLSAAPLKLMYCDGASWMDFGGTPSATACTKNGEIKIVSGELNYCNSSVLWPMDSGAVTNGSCTKSGEFKFNGVSSKMEFCNGSNWRVVSPDANPDSFTFSTTTAGSWQAAFIATPRRVTGFTGGIGTWTAAGTTCTTYGYRVCADSACAQTITQANFAIGSPATAYIPNGAYVRASMTSAIAPTETCTISLDIGSVTAVYSITTAVSDTIPGAFSWAATRNASPSALVTSTAVAIRGHSGVTGTISDMGTGGAPEFRTCQDAGCSTELITWSTGPQTIGIGDYVQLRTTMSAATNSTRRVQFTAGGTSGTWYATTGSCPTINLAAGASTTCTCGADVVALGLNVVGNTKYTQASDVCTAAVHAGVITDGVGGSITVQGVGAGTCASFTGSTSNGVTSTSSGSAATAYFFPAVATDPCP